MRIKSAWSRLEGWQKFYIAVVVCFAVPTYLVGFYLSSPASPTSAAVEKASSPDVIKLAENFDISIIDANEVASRDIPEFDPGDPEGYPKNLLKILKGEISPDPNNFRFANLEPYSGWKFQIQSLKTLPEQVFTQAVKDVEFGLVKLRNEALWEIRLQFTKVFLLLLFGIYLFLWLIAWIEAKVDLAKAKKLEIINEAKRAGREPEPEISFFETGIGRYVLAGVLFAAAFYFSRQSGSESGWLSLGCVLYGLWVARELGYIALATGAIYLIYSLIDGLSTPKAVLLGASLIALAIYKSKRD